MELKLYNLKCEQNRINKINFIVAAAGLNRASGTLREPTSIVNPIIRLEIDEIYVKVFCGSVNYVLIEEFERFYFVEDIIIISNKIIELHLHIDVLMSHRFSLYEQECILERCEDENYINKLLVDNNIPIAETCTVKVIDFYPSEIVNAFNIDEIDGNVTIPYFVTVLEG